MSHTYREYAVRELAISAMSFASTNNNERKQAGDIIVVRKPLKGIGMAEASAYLWVHVKGDVHMLEGLTALLKQDKRTFDKRRYCIPLSRLPSYVDVSKVTDPNVIYQPFLPIDMDTFLFLPNYKPPLIAEQLVFDKETGKYL